MSIFYLESLKIKSEKIQFAKAWSTSEAYDTSSSERSQEMNQEWNILKDSFKKYIPQPASGGSSSTHLRRLVNK